MIGGGTPPLRGGGGGCGGVWSLRALLPQNCWADCQAGCVSVCERERESARPAHLNPVRSNPPTQSQLTSGSLSGPNPHILHSSPLGHKVPFCPLARPHTLTGPCPFTVASLHRFFLRWSFARPTAVGAPRKPLLWTKPFGDLSAWAG